MENESRYEYRVHLEGVHGVLRIIGMVIGGLVLAVLLAFVFGWLVMWLWNIIMPAVFGLKAITYWQAFGMIILAKLFFGGHGWDGHGRWANRHWKKHQSYWGKWDNWAPAGDYGNWRYYEEYWNKEGKAQFEAYLEKIRNEKKEG